MSNWISIWLDKKDLAQHFGQSYIFEPVHFAGTPPMITAIANNEVEIGNLAYSTLPIAIKNAGMEDTRVISDDFQDGVDDHWSVRYDVLKDGPIKKVEDLKGKVVATNAEGSAVDIAMKAMLRKHGLENKRDYTVVEAPFPAMKAMLADTRSISFRRCCRLRLIPSCKIWRTSCSPPRTPSASPNSSCSTRASRSSTRIAPRSSTGWKIPSAFCTGTSTRRTTTRPRRSPGKLVKAPPERFGWVFTKTDVYRDPTMMPNLGALQKNVDMTKELGYASASFDVKALFRSQHGRRGRQTPEIITPVPSSL